jgi:hypothetical protein
VNSIWGDQGELHSTLSVTWSYLLLMMLERVTLPQEFDWYMSELDICASD